MPKKLLKAKWFFSVILLLTNYIILQVLYLLGILKFVIIILKKSVTINAHTLLIL